MAKRGAFPGGYLGKKKTIGGGKDAGKTRLHHQLATGEGPLEKEYRGVKGKKAPR